MKYKRKEDGVIFPWLEENLHKEKTIIDIGARKGNWYKNLLRSFGNNEAYLFEPTPNIAEWLEKRYKNDNIHIMPYALSDAEGNLEFHIDLEKGGWSGLVQQRKNGKYKTIIVSVKSLDSFDIKNVGLIKIDVEGNELKTLRGAKVTITKNKPIIYFECADVHLKNYDYNANNIFDFFDNIDYNILDLDFNICTKEQFENHTSSNSSFYHNFISCPR